MNTLENISSPINKSATSKDSSIERDKFVGGAGDHLQSALDEINTLRNQSSAANDKSSTRPTSAANHLPGLELHDGGADKPHPAASSGLESGPGKPAGGLEQGAAAPGAPDSPHNARPRSGNDTPSSGSSAEHAALSTNPTNASQIRPEVSPAGGRLPFSGF